MTEAEIIEGCLRKEPKAQRVFYERYAPILFGVCKRYMRNHQDAEDALCEGLFKALNNLEKYSGVGNFVGWLRRVSTNECLMMLRRQHNFKDTTNELGNLQIAEDSPSAVEELSAREILALLDALPVGYRTVFNLYVLEGYKHREIAELLGISINTSKSQLILAKRRLKELLEEKQF